MTDRRVPDDFPKEPDLGSVTGVQPKLLVREVDGRYQSCLAAGQLWVRYDACEDLASQLSAYVSRKVASSLRSVARPGVDPGRERREIEGRCWRVGLFASGGDLRY